MLSANEHMFKFKAGWFVTIYNVVFVADMQANGCATFVTYHKAYRDTSSKDLDGCFVSTVWDVKLKPFMI